MRALLLILAILLSAEAHAARLSAGLSLVNFEYEEESDTGDRSHEKGIIPFVDLGARFPTPVWETVAELSLRSTINAMTNWDGTDFNTMKSVGAKDLHTMHHLEAVIARDFGSAGVYAGAAFHSWDRFLAYGSGYREIYQWTTLPLGLRLKVGDSGWEIDAAFIPMISGSLNVILSETIRNGDDTMLTLGSRNGGRIKGTKSFSWLERVWIFSPWVESSAFGASQSRTNATLGEIHEPASQTTLIGVTLSAAFPL